MLHLESCASSTLHWNREVIFVHRFVYWLVVSSVTQKITKEFLYKSGRYTSVF